MPNDDIVPVDAKITTLDRESPAAAAIAIRDGRFPAIWTEAEVRAVAAAEALVIGVKGRRVIPRGCPEKACGLPHPRLSQGGRRKAHSP